MPPIKAAPVVVKQRNSNCRAARGSHPRIRRGPGGFRGCYNQNEALLKLRIPGELRKIMPSVKNFNGSMKNSKPAKSETPIKQEVKNIPMGDDKCTREQRVFGMKRKRGEQLKYQVQLRHERKFAGMIWDVAFCPNGNILVSSSGGAVLCDSELNTITELSNVVLPGGIAILRDETIVMICRNFDTVNFFSSSGTYLRSFDAGPSPQGLSVNSKEELIVSDNGAKNIRVYNLDGELLREIPQRGSGYQMKWPLYMAVNSSDDIIVSDCHQQKVLVFNSMDEYGGELPIKTTGGNQVLRPHGLCVNEEDDIFIVDTSIDSLEVFGPDGSFMQTLLRAEEGTSIKLKVVTVNKRGLLAVGGMMGLVHIYEFVAVDPCRTTLSIKKDKKGADVIVID